jgi:hypothetical protein
LIDINVFLYSTATPSDQNKEGENGWNEMMISRYSFLDNPIIKLDGNGVPVIISRLDEKLLISRLCGAIIEYELVPITISALGSYDFDIGPDGSYHIICCEYTKPISYAIKIGEEWTIEEYTDIYANNPDIEVDRNGTVHMAYRYSSNLTYPGPCHSKFGLGYSVFKKGTVNHSSFESYDNVAHVDLELDYNSRPHISFLECTNGCVIYLINTFDGWKNDVITRSEKVIYSMDFILNNKNDSYFAIGFFNDILQCSIYNNVHLRSHY